MVAPKKRKVTDFGPFFELQEGDTVQACGPVFEGITCLGVVKEVLEDGSGFIEWEQDEFQLPAGFMRIGKTRRPEGLHLVERNEPDMEGIE